jgi:hypothetical protein
LLKPKEPEPLSQRESTSAIQMKAISTDSGAALFGVLGIGMAAYGISTE